MKKIVFLVVFVVSFFVVLDIFLRFYCAIKYKNPEYIKWTVRVDRRDKVTPQEIKMEAQVETFGKAGKDYTKLKSGSYGFLSDRKFNFTVNQLGFRGRDFNPTKQKKRICVFGGSSTFGTGVNDDETYPYYLEELLKGEYEVINCGFVGYGMRDIFYLFSQEAINYKPDIIIINEAYNDANFPIVITKRNYLKELHEKLYYRWMLYTLLIEKYSSIKNRSAVPLLYFEKSISNDFYKYLKMTIELALKNNIKVVLIKQPLNQHIAWISRADTKEELEYKYKHGHEKGEKNTIRHYYYNLQTEELSKEYNVPLIDITKMEQNKDYFLDCVHYNISGNKKIAEEIYDVLSK